MGPHLQLPELQHTLTQAPQTQHEQAGSGCKAEFLPSGEVARLLRIPLMSQSLFKEATLRVSLLRYLGGNPAVC